jgi:frataxin
MDNTEFTQFSEATLQNIYDALEAADTDYQLEIDLLDGILNIELPDGGQYIINKHNASKQIWLSSPISGASHFSYVADNKSWVDSKGNNLREMLSHEMKKSVGIDVVL